MAIGDCDVLCSLCISQRIRTFKNNGVIVKCVDVAVADSDVGAAVNVKTVAVSVATHIVDSQILHASKKQGEMSAPEHADVADSHVAALFKGDGLVGSRMSVSKSLSASKSVSTVNESESLYCDIVQTDAPDERVFPMAMPKILIC